MLEFTGECWVPGKTAYRIEQDHVSRYEFAAEFVPGKHVLDIACGVGYGSRILNDAGAVSVIGVDRSPTLIEHASSNYGGNSLSFAVGDIVEFRGDRQFDVIVCYETIEHVRNYRGALTNLYTLLGRDGMLIVSSPNRPLTSPHAKRLEDRPSNTFHEQEFTMGELMKELGRAGFTVDSHGVFGQRPRPYFSVLPLDRTYARIFNPDVRASARVRRVGILTPRYFVLVAGKH
jgi:O-antigen biosynthesis protein